MQAGSSISQVHRPPDPNPSSVPYVGMLLNCLCLGFHTCKEGLILRVVVSWIGVKAGRHQLPILVAESWEWCTACCNLQAAPVRPSRVREASV